MLLYARMELLPWLDGFLDLLLELRMLHLNVSLRTVSLASWKMSPELNINDDVVKVINHIKAHILILCLFKQLCEESTDAFSYTQK